MWRSTLQEFFSDIELIISNALTYNSDPRNPYHVAALEFRAQYRKAIVANTVSEKRKQSGTNPSADKSSKRAKKAINSILKEYICPISLELPVDPVTAEDGRVYNRADIQWHINNSKHMKNDGSGEIEYRGLKSPMTNEPMGPNLFPATQVRNSIRALIDSGAIEDDEGNAKHWKEVDYCRTKAEGGDQRAMMRMASMCVSGSNGSIRDYEKAYMWVSRAADLDCPVAIGFKGAFLLHGIGTNENRVEGGTLLGIAAARGDALSQHYLGCYYKIGGYEYPKKYSMAKYWLQKAIAHEGESALSKNTITDAKKILEHIKEEEEGGN